MLIANVWVDAGLVNGAKGTVVSICYDNFYSLLCLPIGVTIKFASYTGPTLFNGMVSITPICRSWLSTDKQCSRLQHHLKLAWAVTIFKCQGMASDKAVIDVGKKEFSTGLSFFACSRISSLKDCYLCHHSHFKEYQTFAILVNTKRDRVKTFDYKRWAQENGVISTLF